MSSSDKLNSLRKLAAEHEFVDPVTKLLPQDERQFSSTLCLRHSMNLINWRKVPLGEPGKPEPIDDKCGNARFKNTEHFVADVLFGPNSVLCAEYQFFTKDKDDEFFGRMSIDILVVDESTSTLALIENKLDAAWTHGSSEKEGQLARQLRFLINRGNTFKNRYHIVLSGKEWFERYNNSSELDKTFKYANPAAELNIKPGLIQWEDVFSTNIKAT